MVRDIENSDLYSMVNKMGNVFEPGIIGKYPVIREIKDLMEEHGALKAMMSGSGPTVFGIFDDKRKWRKQQQSSVRADWRKQFSAQRFLTNEISDSTDQRNRRL